MKINVFDYAKQLLSNALPKEHTLIWHSIVFVLLGIIADLLFNLLQKRKEIKELRKLIEICSYCKKIRKDDDCWEQVESYIHKHANVEFSHGVCPECFEKAQKELDDLINNK